MPAVRAAVHISPAVQEEASGLPASKIATNGLLTPATLCKLPRVQPTCHGAAALGWRYAQVFELLRLHHFKISSPIMISPSLPTSTTSFVPTTL